MQQLLEPQFIDLVNGDEQKLVVLGSFRHRPLECQQLIDGQIVHVVQCVRFLAHVTPPSEMTTSRCRPSATRSRMRWKPVKISSYELYRGATATRMVFGLR